MGWIEWFKPMLYLGIGLAFLAFGALLLYSANNVGAMIALGTAVVLLLLPKLENAAEVEAGLNGLKVKVAEVTNVLDRIRTLASLTGKSLANIQVNAGVLGGATAPDRDSMEAEIVANLTAIKAPQSDFDYVHGLYRKRSIYDYTSAIDNHYQYYTHLHKVDPEWHAAHQRVVKNFPPNPDALAKLLDNFDGWDEFTSKLIDDYRKYMADGGHIDPKFWADRDGWPVDYRQ